MTIFYHSLEFLKQKLNIPSINTGKIYSDRYGIIFDDIEQLQMLKINLDSWNKAYEIALNIKFKTWATDKKITFEAKTVDKRKVIMLVPR